MKFVIALAILATTLALPQQTETDDQSDFTVGILPHNRYRRYDQINNALAELQKTYGSNVISVGSLGTTFEKRSISYVKITGSGTNRKRIFIESGIHARERIAPAAALYFIDRLLGRRNLDADAKTLFRDYDWYIVPVGNPDGYEYTFTSGNRYWRKNRRVLGADECGVSGMRGVDINRNFDAVFGGSGASTKCNSDVYQGQKAFSEPESAGIRDIIGAINRRDGPVSAYISLSAFGQTIYTPYSYSDSIPGNNDYEIGVSNKARAAILKATGKTYGVGRSGPQLYLASGTGTDWAFMRAKIGYSASFGLRPQSGGAGGFDLPVSEIVPTGMDVWAGLHAMATNLQ